MQAIIRTGTEQVTTNMTSMTSAIEPHYLERYQNSRVRTRSKLSPGQLHNKEQFSLVIHCSRSLRQESGTRLDKLGWPCYLSKALKVEEFGHCDEEYGSRSSNTCWQCVLIRMINYHFLKNSCDTAPIHN